MKKSANTISVTLWANRSVIFIMLVLVCTLPLLLDWYCQFRMLLELERTALTVAFYCCSVTVFFALFNMDALLRSIRVGEVFIQKNVQRIRTVQWCCCITALICTPAAFCYYPLVFMAVVMGFLSLVVSVVCQVMHAAVAIREENELTV